MKRLVLATTLLLCSSAIGFARQDPANAPASKQDVEKYFAATQSREMMSKIVGAMMEPMHQMMHERYEKDKDKLPADFETRMNKWMDDTMKSFPWDEILDSIVPIYQKHLTKGDIDHLVAFYSSPTGQKFLREMPAVTSEAMQTMMPIMKQRIDAMTRDLQQQVAEMIKQSEAKPGQNPPTSKD